MIFEPVIVLMIVLKSMKLGRICEGEPPNETNYCFLKNSVFPKSFLRFLEHRIFFKTVIGLLGKFPSFVLEQIGY